MRSSVPINEHDLRSDLYDPLWWREGVMFDRNIHYRLSLRLMRDEYDDERRQREIGATHSVSLQSSLNNVRLLRKNVAHDLPVNDRWPLCAPCSQINRF